MESATTEPSIRAGQLPEGFCPESYQELFETFVEHIDIPTAVGGRGRDGYDGIDGADGSADTGDATTASGTAPITGAFLNSAATLVNPGEQYVDWFPPDDVEDRNAFIFKLYVTGDPEESLSGSTVTLPAISYIDTIYTGGTSASGSASNAADEPIRIYLTNPATVLARISITWTTYDQE